MTGEFPAQLICPSGRFETLVSSPSRKNILFFRIANHHYILNRPVPPKGRCATSSTRGGMRWTLMVLLTRALEADGEDVWS